MQVGQKIRDPTLQVAMDPRDLHLSTHVHNLQIREMGLRDRLVDFFILLYPPQEIDLGSIRRDMAIIRISRGHFQSNIGGDDSWIIAKRFQKDKPYTLLFRYTCLNSCPTMIKSSGVTEMRNTIHHLLTFSNAYCSSHLIIHP